jgi:hypothetical protein
MWLSTDLFNCVYTLAVVSAQFFFGLNKKLFHICTPKQGNGSVAQLNRAFDYESKGFWFESRRSHKKGFGICRNLFLCA